jgi:hypothetical protein
MHFDDIHCQHIVLGASGDNGYARLLSAYADSDKLTFLGGPPFEKELVEYSALSFDDLLKGFPRPRTVQASDPSACVIFTASRDYYEPVGFW